MARMRVHTALSAKDVTGWRPHEHAERTPRYRFSEETRARDVLDAVTRLRQAGAVDLHNAAVVPRNAAGQITIHETKDFTPREGASGGAVAPRGMRRSLLWAVC